MVELIRPDVTLHREWLDFLADYDQPGLDGGSVSDELLPVMGDPEVFRTWVKQVDAREHGRELPEGRVSSTSRWALRDGEIVGVIDLRHELTDLLLAWGGHIGYAVRVCARRQGVATEMLRQMLAVATRLGINPVLVTCDEDNVGSRRTIEGAGGVYDGSVEGKRRYWITAADTPIGYAARPLGLDPLRGRLVELRLMSNDEVRALHSGERRPDWASDFPRPDDLDGAPLRDVEGLPGREWSSRLVIRRSDHLVVGTLGFYGPPDPADPARTVEIGYGLVESARGQGLITDALRLAVPAAQASGATVAAHTAYENIASRRALERAGFTATGERNAENDLRYVRARS